MYFKRFLADLNRYQHRNQAKCHAKDLTSHRESCLEYKRSHVPQGPIRCVRERFVNGKDTFRANLLGLSDETPVDLGLIRHPRDPQEIVCWDLGEIAGVDLVEAASLNDGDGNIRCFGQSLGYGQSCGASADDLAALDQRPLCLPPETTHNVIKSRVHT